MLLKDFGELKLIERIKTIVRRRQADIITAIGDDACVLKDGTVATTDSFVEDVHFDLRYMNFFDIGTRTACATLSDIAAIAAEPKLLLVSLFLCSDLKVDEITQLYRGMETIAKMFSVEIAGGDVVSSKTFSLTLTALGKTKKPILRSTARPGDFLYATGYLGLAEAGRLALKNRLSKKEFKTAIDRHLAPIPRIREALKLKKSISALIDTSDGLSTDASHLATESKVRIEIYKSALPIHPAVKEISRHLSVPLDKLLLHSGEDFELLFTSPQKIPPKILNVKVTKIGFVKKGSGVYLIDEKRQSRLRPGGYEHLR
jgi:thiamine-monophosphate kinase